MRQLGAGTVGGAAARAAESLALSALARVPDLADELVRTIQERNPGYRAMGVVPQDDLLRSCRDNIARVLELIAQRAADSGPASGDARYDAARATGRRRAEQ